MVLRLILLVLLAVGVAAFALQNTAAVTVTIFLWKFHGPLAAVLMGAFGAGFLLAALGLVPPLLSGRLKLRALQKREGPPNASPDDPEDPSS
jgi:uncharacterized integral membrane protein